ncbi:unnamed protein product [Laminaria digitata]
MPFGFSSSSSGELFAVGFSGGAVSLYDGRCQEAEGMVGGFLTKHRWLERVRSAGPLLMASYGRNKHIETWDIRKFPSCSSSARGEEPLSSLLPPRPPSPPRLADLTCSTNSPDFWVEPHGLTVAVSGAPRHSQRFGAKHAFWGWPSQSSRTPLLLLPGDAGFPAGMRGLSSVGTARTRGVEVVVPGVVNDSDYRLCLSTGIKFTDTHMATVLDPSRVLVDEIVVGDGFGCGVGGDGGGGCRGRAGVEAFVMLS